MEEISKLKTENAELRHIVKMIYTHSYARHKQLEKLESMEKLIEELEASIISLQQEIKEGIQHDDKITGRGNNRNKTWSIRRKTR
jgi:hypothetical protein